MAKPPPNPFPHDTALSTSIVGVRYIIKADHRNGGNGRKSQWVIAEPAEVQCFERSHKSNWTTTNAAWGLHLPGSSPQVLGRSVTGTDLKIARFLPAANGKTWHGFPADYRRKKQDRPAVTVLLLWLKAGFIRKHDISRVRSGKPCNLSC
jgi:hypothetical protein